MAQELLGSVLVAFGLVYTGNQAQRGLAALRRAWRARRERLASVAVANRPALIAERDRIWCAEVRCRIREAETRDSMTVLRTVTYHERENPHEPGRGWYEPCVEYLTVTLAEAERLRELLAGTDTEPLVALAHIRRIERQIEVEARMQRDVERAGRILTVLAPLPSGVGAGQSQEVHA